MAEDRRRIPVRDPEVEQRSRGNGPVITYMLSPEELARYRSEPVEKQKKPAFIPQFGMSPEEQSRRAKIRYEKENEEDMKHTHITKELLESEFAAGKTGRQIETEQGLPQGSISWYTKKFNVVNPNNKKAAPSVESTPDKADESFAPATDEQRDEFAKKDAEIERLQQKLSDVIGERNQYRDALGSAESEVECLRAKINSALDTPGLMPLDHYQMLASRTSTGDWDAVTLRIIRNPKLLPLLNFALGAAGEAGEIADEIKKVIFHGHELNDNKLNKEIGDALWYLSQLTGTLGYSFESVAKQNIEKLKARYPEGFSETASQQRAAE